MSALLYQHPLAFLVGLEGVALMRAFAGEHDEAFTRARLAETKALLDDAERWGDGVTMPPLSVADGYDAWAPHYDSPDNAIFAVEESVVWPLLGSLPPGDALDVACGTGRHAGRLASLGHRVSGVDASPGMLEVARRNVPGVGFTLGDVHALPVADASVDLVTYGLALCHVEEMEPVFAELARVLRPGGHAGALRQPRPLHGVDVVPDRRADARRAGGLRADLAARHRRLRAGGAGDGLPHRGL